MNASLRAGMLGVALLAGAVRAQGSGPSTLRAAGAPAQTIQVKMKEWTLGMQTVTIKGSTARFEVENDGQYPHAFKLEGKLGEQDFEIATPVLRAGEKSVLIVKLPPGTYEADCPVGDHEERGMKNTVVFGP